MILDGTQHWSALMNINNKSFALDGWPRTSTSYATGWILDRLAQSLAKDGSEQERKERARTMLNRVATLYFFLIFEANLN